MSGKDGIHEKFVTQSSRGSLVLQVEEEARGLGEKIGSHSSRDVDGYSLSTAIIAASGVAKH